MNAKDAIQYSLQFARFFAESLLKDMQDEPLTRTVPETGQHAYWLLGHIVVSEAFLLDMYLKGESHRYEAWLPLFGLGTQPADQIDDGPTYAQLLEALDSVRAATLEYLETISEDDLDNPCHEVDGPGPSFDSIGQCLVAIGQHMTLHAGQVACVRKAAGRKPLLM